MNPIHAAARMRFESADLHGFTAFAPQDIERVLELLERDAGLLIALNAEKVANADSRLRDIVNANFGYPDGMGVVLGLRRLGVTAVRIAGADLWSRIVLRFAADRSFYLVGGTRVVIEATVARLRTELPGIRLNYRDGYLRPEELDHLEADIVRQRPDIVMVGMGSPKQEFVMSRLYEAHPAVYMGLGGSFDVFVGRKRRAPAWMQAVGMEWAYQFARNPRRLRRLPAYAKFAWMLGTGRL